MSKPLNDRIEMRELLDPNPHQKSETRGKVIRWYDQADFVVAISGLFAIAVSVLGIFDAVAESHNRAIGRGGVDEDFALGDQKRDAALHDNDDLLALVLFGLVTALAWFSTSRAIFRVNSIQATPILGSPTGVSQRDISDILELKLPSLRWLSWRKKLWKSSLFAAVNILLYVGSALTYRAAFTTRSQNIDAQLLRGGPQTVLIGCPTEKKGLIDKYASLIDQRRLSDTGRYTEWVQAQNEDSWRKADEWTITTGWHQYLFDVYASRKLTHFTLTGPLVVGVIQTAGKEVKPPSAPDIRISQHEKCGPLPQYCTEKRGNCVWLGISAGTFSVSSKFSGQTVYTYADAKWTPLPNVQCPLRMDVSLYEEFVRVMELVVVDDYRPLQKIFAMFLAVMHKNSSLIQTPELLNRFGLLYSPQMQDEKCLVKNSTYEGMMHVELESNFWPRYQFLACGLIAVWGCLLLFAAYPFRSLLLRGTLDQYMSFGANAGEEDMLGASSGLAGSNSTARWRLRLRDHDGYGRMVLEAVEPDGGFRRGSPGDENLRLTFGSKWL